MNAPNRRRPGLRRYSFTYDDGRLYSFFSQTEEWAMKLARDSGIFRDLETGRIISFEWAKYIR